eukprot:TRINITY_DN836_c0_g1_i11.p1 TRINITY_DN836_c0_g1~~TRINITY_DN836_c0_g1_i11.p1  ORF type:complete len:285 (+),score=93.08 TRINITY_DN836_c0_g1_i11:195-1049(+)
MIKDTKAIDVDTQKIIFKGSAVNDENTLQELGYKEGDFLVLMVVKKTVPLDKKIEAENNKVEEKATNKKPASGEDQAEGVDKGILEEIMKMGFPRDRVIAALKATNNNPDLATDILLSGAPIPTNNLPNRLPLQADDDDEDFEDIGDDGMEEEDSGSEHPLQGLLSNPQFNDLRNAIRENPELLEQILLELQTTNPDLYNAIQQNREQFLRLIMEDTEMEEEDPEGPVVELTESEMEAIERLVLLGFDKDAAIEAYLACDKNETLAANYLFEQATRGEIQHRFN